MNRDRTPQMSMSMSRTSAPEPERADLENLPPGAGAGAGAFNMEQGDETTTMAAGVNMDNEWINVDIISQGAPKYLAAHEKKKKKALLRKIKRWGSPSPLLRRKEAHQHQTHFATPRVPDEPIRLGLGNETSRGPMKHAYPLLPDSDEIPQNLEAPFSEHTGTVLSSVTSELGGIAISSVSSPSNTSLENTDNLNPIQKNSSGKEESMFFMFGFEGIDNDTDYYDTEEDGASSLASESSKVVAIEESMGAGTQSSNAVISNNSSHAKSVVVQGAVSSERAEEAVVVPSSDAVARISQSKSEMKQEAPVSMPSKLAMETAATASNKNVKKHRRRKKERRVSVVSCWSDRYRYYDASVEQSETTNAKKKKLPLPKHTPNALKKFIELATGWKDAHAKMKIKPPSSSVIRTNTNNDEKTKGEQRRYNAMALFEFMNNLNFLLKLVWEIMPSSRSIRAAFKADASFKPIRIIIKSCTKLLQKFVEYNVDEQLLSFRLVMPHHDRDVRKIQPWNVKLRRAMTLVLYEMPDDVEHGFIAAEQMRALGLVKSATAKTKTNNNEKDNDITTDEDYTDVDSDRENAKAAVSVTPKYSVASKSESKQPPTESRNKCMTMISRLWLDHQKKDTAV